MSKIKFDSDSMKLMALFESMTGAKLKDCIAESDRYIFVVEENEMGKAIGKNGINVKKMEHNLKKKIRLVEFSSNLIQFARNAIYPVESSDIKEENGILMIHGKDTNTKAMLIGREKQNLNHLSSLVKRYFDIKDIKII